MCCQQKIHGGLGIKKPHIMNEAFLMKILWNLIHKPDDLWCKVLLSKYGRNNDVSSSCSSQPYDSPLWKALSKVWHNFQRHVVRQIGDGRNTNFWLDKWVPHNVELLPSASSDHIDTTLSVRDVLNQDGYWDVRFLSENLSNDIVSQVIALPAPTDTDGPDTLGWAGTNTHQFTVQSAYTLQHAIAMPLVAEGDWKTLWGWKGPHRIQTFMWLAAHERILTNARRSKWGVGISPTCSSCMREDETTLHVLRDCVHATRVWIRLVPSNYITNFFSFDCREWIFNNLNKKGMSASKDGWKTIFMTTCWLLWTWRNKTIFEDNFQRPHNPIRVIQKYSMDIDECTLRHLHIPQQKETIYIGWRRPPEGWIKLNSDGACKGNNGISGCGGLFRNSDGRWIKGYAKKIGSCDAFHAEMWGLYLGLDMAWRDHISYLIIESDSKLLIDMITGNCTIGGATPILVRRIRKLLALDWQVQVLHTWREGNRSADWLANYSLSMSSFDFSIVESPPSELRSLLFDDLSGACMPRNVRVNP
jgi:ribonuclease HI